MGNSCSGNDLKSQSENENENEYIDEELNEIYENEEYNLGNTLSFSEKIFISSTKEKIKQKNFKNEEFKEINDIDICKWYKTYSDELNKKLPIYIVFNTNYDLEITNFYDSCMSAKNHWNKIKVLINTSVKSCKTEEIFCEELTYEDFNSKIDYYIEIILNKKSEEIKNLEINLDKKKKLIEKYPDHLEKENIEKYIIDKGLEIQKKKLELEIQKKIENTDRVKFFLSNRHVNFYDKNIRPYVLYKKLKIKYDFYYIPLNIYNAIETQINIIKNVQILELLGSNNINIKSETVENNDKNIIGSINTGLINNQINANLKDEEKKKESRDSSYEFLERIFSREDELLTYINLQTHIFMDENDFYSDIELKYLIRARLKSYLQTYSKTFYIKKLSSLEIKIQSKMQKLYEDFGLNFQNNNECFRESNITLDAGFFSLENITTINNIPINSIGFKIISRKFRQNICNNVFSKENNEKFSKEISRFYEKYLEKKYNKLIKSNNFDETFMKFHSELLIDNRCYENLIKTIDTYSDIISNYEIIIFSYKFTPLNSTGFEKMLYLSLYKIIKFEGKNEIIKKYYIGFLQRYLDFNNYNIDIKKYISENNILLDSELINIKNFDEIKELAYKLLIDPNNIPIDNDMLSDIVKINIIENNINKNKIIFKRIIETNCSTKDKRLDKFIENYIISLKVDFNFSSDDLLNKYRKYCSYSNIKIILIMFIISYLIVNLCKLFRKKKTIFIDCSEQEIISI